MIYINKEGIISINNQSKEFIDLKESTQTEIQRLKKFGIEFNAPEESLNSVTVGEAYRTIYEYIRNGSIKTFDDLFGKQIVNSSINYLTKVEADLTGDETLLSVRNAEGKQQYSITQTSAISNMVNSFNSSKSLADFIASNEHLGTVDLNTGEVMLHPYVQNSYVLLKGGRYFDNNGNKRDNAPALEYRYILGMSGEIDSIGESTDVLTFPDKIAQEIYHLLDGTFYTIINSDKASEFGLHIGKFISFGNVIDDFVENEKVINFYKNALYDEVNTAFYEKSEEGTISKIKDYSDNVQKLGHFRNILKLEKNPKLKKQYEDVLRGEMTVEDFVDLPEIETLIVNYLNFKVEKTKKWLVDSGVVTEIDGGYKSNYLPKEKLQELGLTSTALRNYEFTNLVKYLVVNRQLGVFEQHKLIYGHPELYKDLAKRTSGANSQTQVISENPFYLEWMDENMKRYDGLSKRTNTFRYTSYNDPKIASIYYKEVAENIYKDMISPFKDGELNLKLKSDFEKIIGAKFNNEGDLISIDANKGSLMNAYIDMVENDGGSYIMPDFFRDLHFLSGKENKDQIALLDYENASEILDRSNPEHPMYNIPGFAKTYGTDAIRKAKEIKDKGKPSGVMLQVLKPYGFGYNKTTAKRTHTSLLKNSVVPLTWSRVVGKENMLEKYLQSQKDNIDIIAFNGSQKVGFVLEDNGVKVQELYNEDGHINTNANPVQEMYTRYFGFQVEMANYAKDKTIFGTQMRKITLSNLPEELHEAASEYNKLLDALTETEFNALLKQVGLKKEGDDYIVDNVTSMLDSLRSEVIKRDLPENVVDLLESDIDDEGKTVLKYKFDASPICEKLNNILNAIVDNRILAQEMNGKAAIQIPATMFETTDRKFTYLKNDVWQEPISGKEIQALPAEQKKSAKIVSSDLEFYKKTNKDGKEVVSSMEVYAPWFLKGVNPEDVGFELKNGIWMPKDPSAMESFLKSIGFRIPTQGMNSIDSIIIKGFLPEDWGDSVVVPSEIVAKAGSDFDIDKLNMFFKNLTVKDGQIVEITYDIKKENLEKRYNKYINSEYGDILNPLRKILSNIKSKTKENDTVIQKLKNDIEFAEELLLKGDESAGKLIASLFKLEIANFNDLMNADIELQSLQYEGEYLFTVLENAIDKYKETLELVKSKFTLEEFSKLPIEQQNSKKAVQNRLIDLMSEILTHPSNFRQLVSPNSTSTAKPLAEEIRKIKGLKDVETDKTALSEWDVMTSIREAYVTGKKLVGIIALQITSHSLSQYGDVSLTGVYKDETGKKQIVVINLNHSSEEGKFILNLVRDKNYQLISELLSESMNGAVDAAKDPFIFDLNLTLSTASTWFYLQKLGVPIKDLAYLHNQPAIIEYLTTSGKNKSIVNNVNDTKVSNTVNKFIALTPYLFKAFPDVLKNIDQNEMLELLSLTKKELFDKKEGAFNKLKTYKKIIKNIIASIPSKEFTQEDLKNMIKPIDKLSVEQSKNQILLLRNYLEYQKQGQMFSDYIRGISYDTTRNKNLSENKLQENRYNKVVNDGFINLDSLNNLMSKTFLSKIKSIKDAVPDMFKDYFVSLHPKARPFMQKVYDIINDTDAFMTDDEKVLLLNRYENFFLTYLTHVVKIKSEGKESSLNSNYSKMFLGENSIASTLKKYQKLYPNNKALETLFGIINSDVNSTNNVKIFNTKMSTYEINTFGESLVELYDYADRMNNEDLKKFVQELSVFSILQSGVQQSPISFTKILPLDFYSEIVGNIFDNFLSNDDINFTPDIVWKQFNQNNYYNSKLVKTITKQTSFTNDNNVSIEIKNKSDKYFKDDYVVVKYLKKELIGKKEEVQKLIKNKKWDDIYDVILFEKIKLYDSTGKDIGKELPDSFIKYTPINILGNRMYLTEAYATPDVESIIKGNINIDESQYTQAIEDHKRIMSQAYRAKQNNQDDPSEQVYPELGDETQYENVVFSNIQTKDGKYDRDANIKKAQNNNRIYSMETSSDLSFSNPWASFNRTGTIKTSSTEEAVKNYIDWLTTDKFKNIKPERKDWILKQLKSGELKNKPIQYYAELNEPSHATALDYLINRYNWNQPTAQQTPLPPVSSTPTIPSDGKSRPVFDSLPSKSATPTMTYAGIGSRETPQKVLDLMTEAAKYLEGIGYTLNTGKTFTAKPSSDPKYQAQYEERLAFSKKHNGKVGLDEEGADRAFSLGATKKNLFGVDKPVGQREMAVMQEIHPNPSALKEGAKKLMARNTNQVFGENLDTPVDFVLFYAQETKGIRPEGGTGQAVEMARRKGIPTINMADANWKDQLKAVITKAPTEEKSVKNEKVLEGDIFALPGIPVITTNLGGVHGAGLAQLAKAKGLIKQGDGGFKANDEVVQLPVKKVWSDNMSMNNNMELLKESLKSLIKVARENEDKTYLLPLAGLGHGEGSIEEILPLLIKTIQSEDNIKLVLPAENIDLGRQGTTRKDYTRKNMPKIKTMLSKAGLLNNEINDENSKVNYALNEPVITFDELTEFTNQRKQEIITNFTAKHKMSKEEAINYINEALVKDKENTINKLKECY